MAPGDSILRTRDVVKRFGGFAAVDGVSIDVEENRIIGLIGPNGSGKTTLFNVISGVYKPDEGEIYFDGDRIDGRPPHEIYSMGLVRTFQIPRLFQKMTVLDNMLIAARDHPGRSLVRSLLARRGVMKREEELVDKAMEILELLQLDRHWDKPAGELSGGQMKLLEIGRALMSDPKVLLLDEPTAGVNPTLAWQIFERIESLREELGLTFFVIEHRIEVLLEHAHKVYVMHRGKIIAEGDPDEVVRDPKVVDVYLGG